MTCDIYGWEETASIYDWTAAVPGDVRSLKNEFVLFVNVI